MLLQRPGWLNRRWYAQQTCALLFVCPLTTAITPSTASGQHVKEPSYEEVARVGDFGSEMEFGRIGDIVADDSGFVWVADRMHNTMVVLNPRLERVRTVGRAGGGPGEFRSLVELGVVGDTITAYDVSLSRLSLFDRSGNFIRSYTGTRLAPADRPDVFHRAPEEILGGGAFLQRTLHGTRGDPNQALVLVRFDPSRQSRLPLARLRLDSNSAQITFGKRGYVFVQRPVVARDLYAVDPAGGAVVVVNQMLPRDPDPVVVSVRTIRDTGDTASVIRLSVPPRAIDPRKAIEELRPAAEGFAAMLASRAGIRRGEGIKLYMDAMDVPEYQVPFDRLVLSRTGEIYLREGAFGLERARWVVLDPRGRIESRFHLPSDVDVLTVHGDRLIGRTRGIYDESVLTVWASPRS